MPEFTLLNAAITTCIAAGVMTVGFAARETRWGTPLMMFGIVGLLAIIGYGIVDLVSF
ncbi:hypothetical protein QTH90_02420 [Variovorax sp. J2P1-59]|uniref:hypothetical protein n=1 Tax=Variovorax flavidus TaxID=3053501 RepID=UPI002574CDEE|nr:hypothetical protein [Variovorax sp. J2P1-59]MDM0073219.1 hypothetical protein [Variovorax sp. J2P1-59]